MFNPNEIEAMPLELEKSFKALELRIMQDIIRKLKENGGEITRASDWQIYRLYELGKSKEEIKQEIQKALKISDEEINNIYSEVFASGYARDKDLYVKTGKKFIPFEENKHLQQLISSVKKQTKEEFKNITQSLGFAVKQPDGKLKFQPIAEFYQNTIDKGMLDITSGAFDYNTVLKRTVNEMTNSGLRTVDYASGWSNRVDVAARRAILTGFNQVVAKVNEDNAKNLETDTFEISWHSGHRPSHWWGGQWFAKDKLIDICGLGTVEGLCGANCYHSYSPVIPGISVPTYTKEQLEEMEAKEQEKKKYGNKEYTKYEALQRQRRLETTMRAQRQKIKLLQEGGADENDILTARGRYMTTSSEYVRFSKEMGLPQQRERITIDGLRNIGDTKYNNSVEKSNYSGIINSSPFRVFSSGEEVNRYFGGEGGLLERKKSVEQQWLKQLSDDEKQAVSYYCSDGYYDVNAYFRQVAGSEYIDVDTMKEFAADLDSAISKFELKDNITVYRGIDSDALKELDLDNLIGSIYEDKGYMSTSPIHAEIVDRKDALLEIQIPSGQGRGAYVNSLSGFKDDEYEFLVKRGTRCEVTSVDLTGDKPIIRMKVIDE